MRYPSGYSLGEYDIRKLLSSETTADVYLARHRRLENEVTLKVIRPDAAQEWQAQYARAMCRLRHPNIVRVHSANRLEDRPVIVTDYFKGKTLRAILGEKGPLKLEETLRIASCVAEVLDYVHTLEIQGSPTLAHLDLTPASIIIDANGAVKIADFGLVQAVGAALSAAPGTPAPSGYLAPGQPEGKPSTQVVKIADSGLVQDVGAALSAASGTPAPSAYVAPEQLEGRPSTKSDLWAVGVLLCEMLLGRMPSRGPCGEEPPSGVDTQDPEFGPDIANLPDPLRHIVFRCLRRNPDERFASAALLASALAEACSALGLMKCLKCGEPMPSESEVCPECIFAEVRESLSQRQYRSAGSSWTADSASRRRWYAVLILMVITALCYGGYRLWETWQPDEVVEQVPEESARPAASLGQVAGTPAVVPASPPASAYAESREIPPWRLAAASREWQTILDSEKSPEGSYEDQITRLRRFIESHPGTPEVWEAQQKLELWESEGRTFHATEDFEGRPDSRTCAILARWKEFHDRQTTGFRRDYAWDRVQYWTKRVEDYTGYASLTFHSARRLPLSDFGLLGGGQPDAYFLLYEGDKVLYRSQTITDNSSPAWEEKVRIYIRRGMEFHIDIWDDDLFGHEKLVHLRLTPFPVDGPFQVTDGIAGLNLEIQRDR